MTEPTRTEEFPTWERDAYIAGFRDGENASYDKALEAWGVQDEEVQRQREEAFQAGVRAVLNAPHAMRVYLAEQLEAYDRARMASFPE